MDTQVKLNIYQKHANIRLSVDNMTRAHELGTTQLFNYGSFVTFWLLVQSYNWEGGSRDGTQAVP